MKKIQFIYFFLFLSLFLPFFQVEAVVPPGLQGPCTGEILTDEMAARTCEEKAEAQGTALGRNISCDTQKVGLLMRDPNTGLNYYWNTTCTVDGSSGNGAYLLVGFDNTSVPVCSVTQLATIVASGNASGFTYAGCRAPNIAEGGCVTGAVGNPTGACALIQKINPGWAIQATGNAYERAFYQCGGKAPYGSVVNGVSVYSCTDPNPPRPIRPGGGPTPSSTSGAGGTSGDRIVGCTETTGVSTITGESCAGTVYELDKDKDGIPDYIDDEVEFVDNSTSRLASIVYRNPRLTTADPVSPVCPATVRSGIKNGKYRYTFTKGTGSSWTVNLNNPAYSVLTDRYYVPANYSLLVTSASDLNIRNQGRFNHLESLPGTAVGNTAYQDIFGSFINAYSDWDNMAKDATNCITNPNNNLTPNSGINFQSNAKGVMSVGDAWNVTVSGLSSSETIYATGGKKVNNLFPTDKTPYVANNTGVMNQIGAHATEVVGMWHLVWTRANGFVIGTLDFTVETEAYCSASNDNSQRCANLAQAGAKIRGYEATCQVSSGVATCTVNGSTGHSPALMVGTRETHNGWEILRTDLIRQGKIVPAINYRIPTIPVPATVGANPPSPVVPSCYVFTKNLKLGDTGPDVLALTYILKKEGFVTYNKDVFNIEVEIGVKKFQEAHAKEILTPQRLTIGTGFVGESTRAYLNSKCSAPLSAGGNSVLSPNPTPPTSDSNLARYVKVSVADWDTLPLGLREIIVVGANDTIIRPISISTTDVDSQGYQLPISMIDGNENTLWRAMKTVSTCAVTSDPTIGRGIDLSGGRTCQVFGDLQVITIDLGKLVPLSRINVMNYGLTNTRVIVIEVSKDNNSYKQIAESRAQVNAPLADKGVVIGFMDATTTMGPRPAFLSVASMSPTSGVVGGIVTLSGAGFTSTGNKIKFGSLGSENNPQYSVASTDGKTLTFTVPISNYYSCWTNRPTCQIPASPTPPGIYSVSVANINGTSNSMDFSVIQN